MNKPTEEQIKELWEWCGLIHINNLEPPDVIQVSNSCEAMILDRPVNGWYLPMGFEPDNPKRLVSVKDYPTIDLNNLFQWAVPKLGEDLEIELFIPSVNWFCQIKKRTTIIATSNGYHKDPALALFWAIYKVIKGEQ